MNYCKQFLVLFAIAILTSCTFNPKTHSPNASKATSQPVSNGYQIHRYINNLKKPHLDFLNSFLELTAEHSRLIDSSANKDIKKQNITAYQQALLGLKTDLRSRSFGPSFHLTEPLSARGKVAHKTVLDLAEKSPEAYANFIDITVQAFDLLRPDASNLQLIQTLLSPYHKIYSFDYHERSAILSEMQNYLIFITFTYDILNTSLTILQTDLSSVTAANSAQAKFKSLKDSFYLLKKNVPKDIKSLEGAAFFVSLHTNKNKREIFEFGRYIAPEVGRDFAFWLPEFEAMIDALATQPLYEAKIKTNLDVMLSKSAFKVMISENNRAQVFSAYYKELSHINN